MGNSLGDETSCESSSPPPNIFNSKCISAKWPVSFEKNAFEILRSSYMLLSWASCQSDLAKSVVLQSAKRRNRVRGSSVQLVYYYLIN